MPNDDTCDIEQALSHRALWSAVLMRAVGDALGYQSTPLEKCEARRWIIGMSRNFREVCEYSGYDPEIVKSRFLKFEAQLAGKKPRQINQVCSFEGVSL